MMIKTFKKTICHLSLSLFLATAVLASPVQAAEEVIDVVFRKGEIFVLQGEDADKLEEKAVPKPEDVLRVGVEKTQEEWTAAPEALKESGMVVSYTDRDLFTLSSGASIQRIFDDKQELPQFQISGMVHLFVKPEAGKPVEFILNGIRIQSEQLHLFYNGLLPDPVFTVLEGNATLKLPAGFKEKSQDPSPENDTAAQKSGDSTTDAASVAEESVGKDEEKVEDPVELTLNAMQALILFKEEYQLQKELGPDKDPLMENSFIAGFEALGLYHQAGTVEFEGDLLEIKRNEKISQLDISPALIMVGDEVKTGGDQVATLHLSEQDDIRLGGNTVFTIEQYEIEEQKESVLFSFIGSIRARIAKRKKQMVMKFKTVTATIGIKGTDFEALATEASSEVATVEGSVGVSDAAGQGEVLVESGMMTSVAAGAMPVKPVPIPPERLQQLYDDGLPFDQDQVIKLEDVTFISPVDQQKSAKFKVEFKLEPEDAMVEFLLDGKKLIIASGQEIPNLSEGDHQLTIKGIGEEAFSKSVSFKVDRTAPLLEPADQMEKLFLRQGDRLTLNWSEPLATLSISEGTTPLTIKASEDKKSYDVDISPLYQNLQGIKKVSLALVAKDEAENESKVEKSIEIKAKPLTPPILRIEKGLPSIVVNSVPAIRIVADREIEKWQVLLNKKALQLPTPAETPKDPNKEAKPDNKQLLLAESLFKELPEGKHELVVSGVDDFELMGSQRLEIELDKTIPTIADPVTLMNPLTVKHESRDLGLQNLHFKEGESLLFSWSEPVEGVTLSVGQQNFPLSKTEDGKGYLFKPDQAKRAFAKAQSSVVSMKAVDKAGNKANVQGTLYFKTKPATTPKIVIGTGVKKVGVNKLEAIKIEADRELYQWKLILDGKELTVFSEEEEKKAYPSKSITLPASTFAKLTDGSHRLLVTGSDAFNLNGMQELSILLDQKKPKILFVSESTKLESIRLNIKATVDIEWNEEITRVEGFLKEKPWPLKLSKSKKRLYLYGDPNLLSFSPVDYKVLVYDAVGNFVELKGEISLRKPRTQALYENQKNTILRETRNSIDEILLTDRPAFEMSTATPEESTATRSPDKPLLKKKLLTESEFLKKLDEPLLNMMDDY